MQLTAVSNKFAGVDRFGGPIVVIEQNRPARTQHQELAQGHGQPGHICRPVYPWQKEFWGAGVHMGRHDCPDGGCR